MLGGMGSTIRLTTASTSTGPSCARFRDAMLDVARILEADPAHADGFRHRREIRILELGAEVEKSRRLLLDLDEAERAVVEHDHLDRQIVLNKRQKVAHQHREAAVAGQRNHLSS